MESLVGSALSGKERRQLQRLDFLALSSLGDVFVGEHFYLQNEF